ncbi:hypothetical protein [Leuconostoc gelidum]|uniref:hypothetical protein n=1 Tax=Leuconostoc gelidum TaxID=1244 RepID=UPI001CC5F9E5|nr:hypothetical protein [Leuconostoc gelidum]
MRVKELHVSTIIIGGVLGTMSTVNAAEKTAHVSIQVSSTTVSGSSAVSQAPSTKTSSATINEAKK